MNRRSLLKPLLVAPAVVDMSADAFARQQNHPIVAVEFYNGTTLVGTANASPYQFAWRNVPAGSYSLTAKAINDKGEFANSPPISVFVDAAPSVALTAPSAHSIVNGMTGILLTANATDSDGSIAKVEFYHGATLIGTSTTAPYSVTWNSASPGNYSLTAIATDNLGAATSSVAVPVTVNTPPTITLTGPGAGSVGIAPASFTLTASATDSDGTIAKVEFYQGSTLIGSATTSTSPTAPYSLAWGNVGPGNYSLTATATDNLGIQTTSSPINVSVIANSPPAISLTSPTPNQSIKAPANITLTANASDPDTNLAKVEFFQNGSLIATLLSPPYTASWSNVPPGSYQITAIATDAIGAQTSSAPTSITVTPAQASLYFIHPDHLGTPRLVTDEQNNTVWRNLPTTEPFGNTPPEEDPNATGQRFEMNLAFPGQYRDKESSLSYNFFRDYSSGEGRYRQSDPIGLMGGVNTYTYVNGNPVSFTDPDGLRFRPPMPRPVIPQTAPQPAPSYRPPQNNQYQDSVRDAEHAADVAAALTGAGEQFRHPSVPNAIEALINPQRVGPFVPIPAGSQCTTIYIPNPPGQCSKDGGTWKTVCGSVVGPR